MTNENVHDPDQSGVPEGLVRSIDGKMRCFWQGSHDDYRIYHDTEWGNPVKDDTRLFEKICLEGFQSGLSWLTILRKRENFRAAFQGFDMNKVAAMNEDDIERLMQDTGIVRHRGKIRSTINNASKALILKEEFGTLAAYFWSFEAEANASRPALIDYAYLMANTKTDLSLRISKDLKKRGWSFVGPTTVYAFMEAMGLINDHIEGCCLREPCLEARAKFIVPISS